LGLGIHGLRHTDYNSTCRKLEKFGFKLAQEIKKVLPEVVRDWEYQVAEEPGRKTKCHQQN